MDSLYELKQSKKPLSHYVKEKLRFDREVQEDVAKIFGDPSYLG